MYQLDTNQARAADHRGGFITETGKYIGTFLRAEQITSQGGTKGIDFTFKAGDGRSCRFALYTDKADGSQIKIGRNFVMALLTCLKLREITAAATKVKKWDADANAEIEVSAPCFAALMNKPIGVLLEAEEYEKRDGAIGKRMVLAGVFQADTELTAGEILDRKAVPAQLGKIVDTLRDRPLRVGKRPSQSPSSPAGTSFDDMDSDIPF